MDKLSFTVVYTDDAIKEIDKLMDTKTFFLSSSGELVFSPDIGTIQAVVASLNNAKIYE
jgi:hypothetical protein